MVNESNNINLTIENKKPVETVCEIKDEYEIPSFEQFMRTYESDEKLMDSYRNEIDSYGDIGVERGMDHVAIAEEVTTFSNSNFQCIMHTTGVRGDAFYSIEKVLSAATDISLAQNG
jgi:hypothetical protein